MEFEITTLSNVLGAEVVGRDLAKPLSDAEFARVEQAFHDTRCWFFGARA